MSVPPTDPPITRLPPETLSEILTLVPPCGTQLVQRDLYPWKLAFVCKLWRDVVFSTPKLWADITVALDPLRLSKIDVRGDSLVAAWQLCLDRSGDYPLSVRIDASTSGAASFVPRLLLPLMKHVGQWEAMIFEFPLEILIPFVKDPNLRFPRLRNLNLSGCLYSFPHPDVQPPQIQLFSHAPSLSRVQFQEFPYPPTVLKFPWTQITELRMFMIECGVDDLLEMLENTPNLSNLTFSKFHGMFAPGSTPRPMKDKMLKLPNLRRISWVAYMFDSSPFFNSITAPKLSEIEYQCDDRSWVSDGTMERFLRRSRCTVTMVWLSISSPVIVASFLGILPDVEEVRLSSTLSDTAFMRVLTLDKSSSTAAICPKMKKLVMENMTMREETHDSFVKMAQSRLRRTLDPSEGEGQGSKLLSSLKVIVHSDETSSPYLGMTIPYRLLEKTLSPEELKLVTYEERRLEDRVG